MVFKRRHGMQEGRNNAILYRLPESQRTNCQGQVPVAENRHVLRYAQWIALL